MPLKRDQPFAANINLTALSGALLVLLVVFMIAAPLKQVAVPLELPHGHYDREQNAVFVSLRADGKIFVETNKPPTSAVATWQTLAAALVKANADNQRRKVYVRADQDVRYADVVRLMDALRLAGYPDAAIVPEDIVD